MLNVTIDGVKVSVPAGTTVLEAARKANIHIPTLCYLKDINQIGACRMCVVDVGARALAAACVMPVSEGMVVKTNTPAVRTARKGVLELILAIYSIAHPAVLVIQLGLLVAFYFIESGLHMIFVGSAYAKAVALGRRAL
jgi:NADH dehydrogenase/NADH:ubiquinone oxidoreductase subunit G